MLRLFRGPILIGSCIAGHLLLQYGFGLLFWANLVTWIAIVLGGAQLLFTTIAAIKAGHTALDYIAILAIGVALFGHYYLVAAVILLMLSGGYALESYGVATAKRALTALEDRIPNQVNLWKDGHIQDAVPIETVQIGQDIMVRKGEVISLDGILKSDFAETDESSITGEPSLRDARSGDCLRSGTVNIGDPIVIQVTAEDQHSTYRAIISMVQHAQVEKSPMIRLADRYSQVFIVITVLMAVLAYWVSHDMSRVLAVLVVATPCPLILATPIALMGGVSAASKRHIIVKNLGSIETLSKVNAVIFDKTGTLTLGRPIVKKMTANASGNGENELLAIAAAIERNSLHPLAKAIVQHAKAQRVAPVLVQLIKEEIGAGISGMVNEKTYFLSKIRDSEGMAIGLYDQAHAELLRFDFEDQLKVDSPQVITQLKKRGLRLLLLTGDKIEKAKALMAPLGIEMELQADCTPEQKKDKILSLKRQGFMTAMIGDGINDAPALATADVGLVFSHDEKTASTDAADIVFLGGDLALVLDSMNLSINTIRIARQCILFGIGASVVGMVCAVLGILPPILGAVFQEVIDVVVIVYALRTRFV